MAAVARAGAAVVVVEVVLVVAGPAVVHVHVLVVLGVAGPAVVHVLRLVFDLVVVLVDDRRGRSRHDCVPRLGLRPGGLGLRGLLHCSLHGGVGRALVLRRHLGRGGPGRRQHGEGDERGCEQQKAPHDSPFRSDRASGFV
jgi:hypothetical protein